MGKPRLNQRWLTPQPVFHPHVILEEVGQLARSLAPATPYSTLCLQNLFPSLPRPWSRRQAPGDGWLPAAVGRGHPAARSRGAVAGSLLVLATGVLVPLQSSESQGLEGLLVPQQPCEGFVAAVIYTFGCAHPARRVGWEYVPGTQSSGCLPS